MSESESIHRCPVVAPYGWRCGGIAGHDGDHHALYETSLRHHPEWKRMPEIMSPRRSDMQRWTPAERAISDAMQAVEAMPADVRLTDAVILLGQAQAKVADFVDGVDR